MPTTSDRRRESNRRQRREPAEALERQRSRRAEERRESVRTVRRFTVVESLDGRSREYQGNLSLEGAYFVTTAACLSPEVEILVRLPDMLQEVRLPGTVIRTEKVGASTGVHVRFGELEVRGELALARLLDFEERLEASRESKLG